MTTEPTADGLIAALRASGYVIVRADAEQEIRARIAADLRRAADGRREYAQGYADVGKDDGYDRLTIAADVFESAAAVAEDPARLRGLIPSWRWSAEEHAAVLPQERPTP